MRPSPSRAVPVRPREGRLREAGLSGARTLSRLIVALIENLGAQDRVGRRREPGWSNGARLAAFGPNPLGQHAHGQHAHGHHALGVEIERVAKAAPVHAEAGRRDAVTGLPVFDEPEPLPLRTAAPQGQPTPRQAAAKPPPPAIHPATAEVPIWQRPFFAMPGVRYMRTPDHLLRRARASEAPITPILPDEAGADASDSDMAGNDMAGNDLILPEDLPIDLEEIDGPEFDIDVLDEVADLSIEEQAEFETRTGVPWRLRMSSGFAAELPHPANDLARRARAGRRYRRPRPPSRSRASSPSRSRCDRRHPRHSPRDRRSPPPPSPP